MMSLMSPPSTPPLSWRRGFTQQSQPPLLPTPSPAIKRQNQWWWYQRSATELFNLQGQVSNHPKEDKTGNVLKISLMGSEIKLSEEGATYYVKSLNLLEGEKPIPLPTPTCKITGRAWDAVGIQPIHGKHMMPRWPFPVLLLFIIKFRDQDWDKKLPAPAPKSGGG